MSRRLLPSIASLCGLDEVLRGCLRAVARRSALPGVSALAVAVLAVAGLTLVSCQADPSAGSGARHGGPGPGHGSVAVTRAAAVATVSAPLPGTTASYLGVFENG